MYLEGPVATLDQAIDGNPGGLAGGKVDRRSFLARSGVVLGAAGAAAYVDMSRSGGASAATNAAATEAGAAVAGTDLSAHEPFTGVHQSGILNPAPAQATLVALDSFAPTPAR